MRLSKFLLSLVLALPLAAYADSAYIDSNNRLFLVAKSTQTLTLGTEGAGTFNVVYANTPVAVVDATGVKLQSEKGISYLAYVPTVASTPVAGTNIIKPGLNIIPTAAANTALFIGAATPVVGQHFIVNNSGANAVYLKAAGGATLNGATAGGRILVAALATVECFTVSATNQVCTQPVVPTPAAA